MNKSLIALIGAVIVVGLVGCGAPREYADSSSAKSAGNASAWSNAATRAGEKANGSEYATNGAPMHAAARQPGADRSVIHSANMGLEVEKISEAEKGMKKVVKENGGFIVNLQSSQQAGENPTLTLTLKVPEKNFEDAMTQLEGLGFAAFKNISASDITEEILSAEAQLKQLQNEVPTDGRIGQSPYLKNQIDQVRAQRDQLMLQASMSTIDLTMQQKPNPALMASSSWGSDTWNAALSSAMTAFRVIGATAIWLLVYSPIWGVLLFGTIWVVKHSKRSRVAA